MNATCAGLVLLCSALSLVGCAATAERADEREAQSSAIVDSVEPSFAPGKYNNVDSAGSFSLSSVSTRSFKFTIVGAKGSKATTVNGVATIRAGHPDTAVFESADGSSTTFRIDPTSRTIRVTQSGDCGFALEGTFVDLSYNPPVYPDTAEGEERAIDENRRWR